MSARKGASVISPTVGTTFSYVPRPVAPRFGPVSSQNVVLSDAGRALLASVDRRTTVTAADAAVLRRLLAPTGADGSPTVLQTLLADPAQEHPDFVAVRTGAGVTGELWGGGNVSSWTDGGSGTTITLFGGGSPPNAFKGVAVTYGPRATAGDRDNQVGTAMAWLADHLDDHQVAGGVWAGSLFDATL